MLECADSALLSGAIRVVIASDIRLYREGLAGSLSSVETLTVVGTAVDVRESLDEIVALRADVVLVEASGAAAGARLLADAAPDARVVALAVTEADADVIPLVEAGVVGYLTTEQSLDDLADLIVGAARGESPCSPSLAAMLVRRVAELAAERRPRAAHTAGLTRRELEILDLIGRGLSNKEIAGALHIELATVKNHVHHILAKLNVSGRTEAAALLEI
jgi:DNA-binding NarL/FixJ family response regulator